MKDEDHAELGESVRPDMAEGQLAITAIAVPDDLGDPRFIEPVENTPEIERPERCPPGAECERREKEEVGEIEPVRHDPCPRVARSRIWSGGPREHLGADEDNQPDEQARGHDTRLPLVRHDSIGFRCHCRCTPCFLPCPDRSSIRELTGSLLNIPGRPSKFPDSRAVPLLRQLATNRRPVQDFIASPGSTRWPRRKSAAGSGFLPGSWRSNRRTAAAPAATIRRSALGFDDGAGRVLVGCSRRVGSGG